MANSSIIGIAKNKIIKEFIKDSEIVQAIDSSDVTKPENLINTHIFDFNQNPYTINKVLTFVTIQVHIPQTYNNAKNFIYPTIEIWIISHVRHMVVDNIPKITVNRNDYLSQLIDKKINGRLDMGIGGIELVSNIEGAFQQDYVYRKMVFRCLDVNDSFCDVDA